jgi:hypothetical protein
MQSWLGIQFRALFCSHWQNFKVFSTTNRANIPVLKIAPFWWHENIGPYDFGCYKELDSFLIDVNDIP